MPTADEREYLFRLAGESPPAVLRPSGDISPGLRSLLDSLPDTPAYVVDAKYDVLAWNQLATCFIGDLSGFPRRDRNMLRWMFRPPAGDGPWSDEESVRFARSTVADLRAAYARHPADPGLRELITEMLALSPVFAQMWAEHEVASRQPVVKRFVHPAGWPPGIRVPGLARRRDRPAADRLLPAPGSPTQDAFRLLAARAQSPAGT